MRYVDHGEVEIDNNLVENGTREIALTRKSFLFVGSEKRGHRTAMLYSRVESCKRLEINSVEYLTDVLTRIRSTPPSEVAQRTPARWKIARESHSDVVGCTQAS